jgi:hypothetical protein
MLQKLKKLANPQAFLVETVIKLLAKQFKLDKVLAYVEDDNDLDREIIALRRRVEKLETEVINQHNL